MRFDFVPGDNVKAINEYISNIIETSQFMKGFNTIKNFTGIVMIFIFGFLVMWRNSNNLMSSLFIIIGGISFGVVFILIENTYVKRRNNIKIIKNEFCDLNSKVFIEIEDDTIVRENEFSRIEIYLSEIESIKLLNYGCILQGKNNVYNIFIPKNDEYFENFINILKSKIPTVKISGINKKSKFSGTKIILMFLGAGILGVMLSFMVNNVETFTPKEEVKLIKNNEFILKPNNSCLYNNEELGLEIYFPMHNASKYGVEELADGVNIYYAPKKLILFTIRNSEKFKGSKNYNLITSIQSKGNIFYLYGPKRVAINEGTAEYKEYMRLYNDVGLLRFKFTYF